jgi:hypothetical protein
MMLDHSWQKEVFDVLRVPGPAQVPIPAFDHPRALPPRGGVLVENRFRVALGLSPF